MSEAWLKFILRLLVQRDFDVTGNRSLELIVNA